MPRPLTMPAPLTAPLTLTGPAIVTRYKGPTDRRPEGHVIASHKRDDSRTYRATVSWNHAIDSTENHRAAALACLARCEFSQDLTLAARGHDDSTYVWVAVGLWQLEPAALALAACQELLAAVAGGADAAALALPVALARQATGAAPVVPTVCGWATGPRKDALTLTDALGRPIDGLSFGGELSPAGAMAAARAAGWALTAPMAALAHRWTDTLAQAPNPAAVAQALSARGGCPAVIATLNPSAAQGVAQ